MFGSPAASPHIICAMYAANLIDIPLNLLRKSIVEDLALRTKVKENGSGYLGIHQISLHRISKFCRKIGKQSPFETGRIPSAMNCGLLCSYGLPRYRGNRL